MYLTQRESESLANVLRFFDRLGYPMEHYPADGEAREAWQHDGGLDGIVIYLCRGVDCLGRASLFGDITFADGSGSNISGPLAEWLFDQKAWVRCCLGLTAAG